MNAKEMFEELGYQRNEENEKIIYLIETKGSFYYQEIIFNLLQKVIVIDGNFLEVAIETNLLKAIDKQANELGWIEEEKQEIKQETNYEHYKDEIIEYYGQNLAVVKGRPTLCCETNCNNCDFKINQIGCRETAKYWLKKPYKKLTYKLNKFEIDLLQSCSQGYSPKYQFKNINSLTEMRKNGYFKCVNRDETIGDILAKSEVVG